MIVLSSPAEASVQRVLHKINGRDEEHISSPVHGIEGAPEDKMWSDNKMEAWTMHQNPKAMQSDITMKWFLYLSINMNTAHGNYTPNK